MMSVSLPLSSAHRVEYFAHKMVKVWKSPSNIERLERDGWVWSVLVNRISWKTRKSRLKLALIFESRSGGCTAPLSRETGQLLPKLQGAGDGKSR